ncbi:MAG: cytochrome c [Nitrospirae bacterium]|nr:cytochrome c [Nitrospirota bacterium]
MRLGEKIIFLASGFIGLLAVVFWILAKVGVIHTLETTEVYEFTAESKAGYQIYKKMGCNNCHVAYKMGEWGVAPGLDGEGTRRTRVWISSYLSKPASVVPGSRHDGKFATDFSELSPQERGLLEAFLMSLKALPGSPNYPKPPE